jgi:hypothetical protein
MTGYTDAVFTMKHMYLLKCPFCTNTLPIDVIKLYTSPDNLERFVSPLLFSYSVRAPETMRRGTLIAATAPVNRPDKAGQFIKSTEISSKEELGTVMIPLRMFQASRNNKKEEVSSLLTMARYREFIVSHQLKDLKGFIWCAHCSSGQVRVGNVFASETFFRRQRLTSSLPSPIF